MGVAFTAVVLGHEYQLGIDLSPTAVDDVLTYIAAYQY